MQMHLYVLGCSLLICKVSKIYQIFNSLASFFCKIFSLVEGKPILLYKYKIGDVVSTIPTIGFNKHYYHGSNAIIFVVDSTDRERISQVKEEIDNLLTQDEIKGIQILIFANKQDMDNAMNTAEM
ncbi:hypothetical protein ACTFIT_011103 [Dictyostelium discoideum]